MRFRIWHLMALTALVAFIIGGLELSSFRTTTVRFASPTIPPQLPQPNFAIDNTTLPPTITTIEAAIPIPTHYWLSFETLDGRDRKDGVVSTKFGYNSLLKKDVRPDNLPTLEGVEIRIRYRYRTLPWATATQIQSEIAKHFEELHPIIERNDSRPPNAWMAAG